MTKKLALPNNFIINDECSKTLQYHLGNHISKREMTGKNANLDILLGDSDYIRIRYNHHFYKIAVVKKDDILYWYLSPYREDYFIYPAKNIDSFDVVVQAIKEHDFMLKGNQNL